MPRTLDLNDEDIKTVLATPLQGEDEIIAKYAPEASDNVKAAMAASLRLLVAASEETGPEVIANIAKAAFTKGDEGDKEEEERKRKAAEEEERKAKAAEEEEERKRKEAEANKNKAKNKGKAFPGAKAPFGGGGADDEDEAERKRKMVAKAAEDAAAERDKKIARLEGDLATERGLRLQREAEAEAEQYRYVPVGKARLADLIRKADEMPQKIAKEDGQGQETWGEAFRGLLKSVNAAIEASGILSQRGSDLVGNAGGAREKLNAMARERLTKADGKESFEQAFSNVVRANPALYAQYLKEEHPSRH